MKILSNDVIDFEIITNKTEPGNWGPSCYSCNKKFEVDSKKIKWRTKIIGFYNYSVWKIQCPACAILTMRMTLDTFQNILQDNIIPIPEPSPMGEPIHAN